jgi:hypothetical protein
VHGWGMNEGDGHAKFVERDIPEVGLQVGVTRLRRSLWLFVARPRLIWQIELHQTKHKFFGRNRLVSPRLSSTLLPLSALPSTEDNVQILVQSSAITRRWHCAAFPAYQNNSPLPSLQVT